MKKLNSNKQNTLTVQELKEAILSFYYPRMELQPRIWKSEFKRDMIITKIENNYGSVGTIVFSINGSPPKGIGVFNIIRNYGKLNTGILRIFSRDKISRGFLVFITDLEKLPAIDDDLVKGIKGFSSFPSFSSYSTQKTIIEDVKESEGNTNFVKKNYEENEGNERKTTRWT